MITDAVRSCPQTLHFYGEAGHAQTSLVPSHSPKEQKGGSQAKFLGYADVVKSDPQN